MSSNTTSTDTGVPSTSATPSSSQPASTPASSSVQPSSSAIANNSPTSIASSTESTSSTSSSSSTPVSISSTSSTSSTSSASSTSSTTSSSSSVPTTSSTSVSSTPSSTPSVAQTSTSPGSTPSATIITRTSANENGSTVTITQTSTNGVATTPTGSSTSSSTSGASAASLQPSNKGTSGGLSRGGTTAVAVVVPIVAVALLIVAGLYFWRKRKQRKDAEELRRKEIEDYGYNPNNDPTLPTVGGAGVGSPDGPYEMREDGSSGYRGWGTTAVASSGRKASTTISGGQSPGAIGMAYSEGTSPTHGPVSDTRSDNPLVDGRPLSGEGESLGAMGPAASGNRSDINRGPSNASSSYSAANRSDGSGEMPGSYGAGQYYNGNNQYDAGNPYSPETQYGSPPGRAEMAGQPIIRDVQARRNTRIENPAHFPQQSAGISQNF